MKAVEVSSAETSLADFVRQLGREPVVLTDGGVPVAVLLPVENADLETISLSLSPKFLAIIERSRRRYWAEGGLSTEEVRRLLDAEASEEGKPPAPRRKRKAN